MVSGNPGLGTGNTGL